MSFGSSEESLRVGVSDHRTVAATPLSALWNSLPHWVVSVGAFLTETPKRPAGEAWVVTASDKIASRPVLVRANVPFKTAAR